MLHRLSALAIRWRRSAAGSNVARAGPQGHDRQSLCDLRPVETSRDQGDDVMNIQFREHPEQVASIHAKTAIADCDIHPARATRTELHPYLATRWQHHLEVYGVHAYQGMMEGPPYPKA